MSGISRIQRSREDFKKGSDQGERVQSRELWLKDGDQVFLTSIATGDENDIFLDEFYLYTFRVGNRWTNLLRDERVDTSEVPDDTRPSHKFAFWSYVYSVIHLEKKNPDWEEVEGPGGKKVFKETINDFKVIALAFGRGDYLWNQLVDVYSDWGTLNKGVIRIKRTGAGAYDTSYSIGATPKKDEIPEDKVGDVKDLPTIREYFFERYGASSSIISNKSFNASASSTTEDTVELF